MAKSVLFIGNSYTYFNDLPGMFGKLARTARQDVETDSVTSGGKSLEWHWYNPESLDAIDAGGRDYVVLQELSTGSIEAPEKMHHAAERLAARIRKAGAMPVFYMTWARQNIPEMQSDICDTYRCIGRELGILVAPVGSAWQLAMARMPGLTLHTADRSHPNVLGSYLAACVFYATLLNADPTELGNTFSQLDHISTVIAPDVAQLLQEAARDAVNAETVQGQKA